MLSAIAEAEATILEVYGTRMSAVDFDSAEFLSEGGRELLVARLAQALHERSSFVVTVGGMSDVAGHGNLFEESYPVVLQNAVAPVLAVAGVRFEARNMAMGGVPSFPNSACMVDTFGKSDVVVWDFRMVERDQVKGEMYVRQALLMDAFVCFKRKNQYLKALKYAHPYIHVLDEMHVYNLLQKKQSMGVTSDKFCERKCDCPGQVRWHAGWKMQRFRGLHMALFYLRLSRDAVNHAGLQPTRLSLPPPVSKQCRPRFCSEQYRCAMTWGPKLGPSLHDIADTQHGLKGWKLQHASRRAAEITRQGQSKCGYKDEKMALTGDASSHWIFFELTNVKDTIAFCGDFQSKDFAEYALIVVNQEEVMDKLEQWLESKTLGVASSCFSTSHNVQPGTNIIGFRVTAGNFVVHLTHLLWNDA